MKVYKRCKLKHIICDECGRKFKIGFDKFGLPNGVCFEMVDGSKVDVCGVCIDKLTKFVAEKKEDTDNGTGNF